MLTFLLDHKIHVARGYGIQMINGKLRRSELAVVRLSNHWLICFVTCQSQKQPASWSSTPGKYCLSTYHLIKMFSFFLLVRFIQPLRRVGSRSMQKQLHGRHRFISLCDNDAFCSDVSTFLGKTKKKWFYQAKTVACKSFKMDRILNKRSELEWTLIKAKILNFGQSGPNLFVHISPRIQ